MDINTVARKSLEQKNLLSFATSGERSDEGEEASDCRAVKGRRRTGRP